MNEAQVRTLEQVRQVVAGTQALEFRRAEDDEGRYAWIAQVLQRFGYRQLGRSDRGAVLAYLQRLSGYSRAQLTRLVSRWAKGLPLTKNYRAPEHAFARRYTAADVALLAEVDRAMGTLSGPATACVLRRQRDVFGDARFEQLGSISVAHLYNLRASAGYRTQRVVLTKTRGDKAATIGVRKAPAPEGRPGFIRIDSVHQGDHDGIKGVYHINAVDIVTQWQVVVCVEHIGHSFMKHAVALLIEQFPFTLKGIHADNGVEYINWRMLELMEDARIELTKSRPRRSTDNALVEGKNAAVVRKMFGFAHIARSRAGLLNEFNHEHFNPLNNLHRPCLFARLEDDPKKPGRTRKGYDAQDAKTPLEKLASLPTALRNLKPGVTLKALQAQARRQSDLQAAQARNAAWEELTPMLYRQRA